MFVNNMLTSVWQNTLQRSDIHIQMKDIVGCCLTNNCGHHKHISGPQEGTFMVSLYNTDSFRLCDSAHIELYWKIMQTSFICVSTYKVAARCNPLRINIARILRTIEYYDGQMRWSGRANYTGFFHHYSNPKEIGFTVFFIIYIYKLPIIVPVNVALNSKGQALKWAYLTDGLSDRHGTKVILIAWMMCLVYDLHIWPCLWFDPELKFDRILPCPSLSAVDKHVWW